MTNEFPLTRILMIDDDVKLCRLVKDYLMPMGYDVESARTPGQAVWKGSAAKTFKP